jgi:hypothetical protein
MAVYGSALKSVYGGSAASVRSSLKQFTFTFPREDGTPNNVSVWVHKKNMYNRLVRVNAALCALYSKGGGYTIHDIGCFNWRLIRGSLLSRSMHSGAVAIDINPAQNPMSSRLVTDMSASFVKCWTSNGFLWGGSFPTRKDAMHFELASHTEPALVPVVPVTPSTPATPTVPSTPLPVPKVMPLLSIGSKDIDHVKALQRELNTHRGHYSLKERVATGWPVLNIDGDYGNMTAKAVKGLQKLNRLTADGVCGPNVWRVLGY